MRTETSTYSLRSKGLAAEAASVSIVIVVWNAKKYVMECLESLREHCRNIGPEVIVVDNCSTDGTPEMVAEQFPEFKLIRNPENYGFAKANNIGIAQTSGDYVCLVNSDVKFLDDCITPIIEFLHANPKIAMVGPKMLAPNGEVARSTMRFPTVWNYICRAVGLDLLFKKSRLFGGFLMSDFDHQTTRPVEVLNGWFVVARREAIQRVGLLDAEFFMYGEDIDWCYRFHQCGEPIFFFAGAGAIHYGGASSSNAPIRFYLEMCRADLQLWRKHHGWLGGVTLLGILALHHSIRLVGMSLSYLALPSQREHILPKLKRSLATLEWLFAPTNQATAKKTQPTRRRESPAA